MEFDKSKVFTVVNADELKLGSIGYFANSLQSLKTQVEQEEDTATTLIRVAPGNNYPFIEESGNEYFLFYLVEEPEEKKFRPYKNCDEMIEDFKRRYNSYGGWSGKDNPMYNPLIWVKKRAIERVECISSFNDEAVYISLADYWYSMEEIFKNFTYLDDSPCGIEEE